MLTNVSYFLTAPSAAPKLETVEIRYSQVNLRWDKIPLNETNGIIQGYTIYFWNDTDDIQGIQGFKEVDSRFLDGSRFLNSYFINHNVSIPFQVINTNKTSAVVKDLQPFTIYSAFVEVHTMGGSFNGSVQYLTTGSIGEYLWPYCSIIYTV